MVTWWQSLLIALAPAIVSGIFSYILAIRKAKKEMEQMAERHNQEMETLREQYKLELEKIRVQQEHEKKLKEQETVAKVGGEIISSVRTGLIESEEMKKSINGMVRQKFNKKGGKR